jgi:hypothetical protein
MPDGFFLMPEAAICKVAVPSSLAYYIRSSAKIAVPSQEKKKKRDGMDDHDYHTRS